MAAAGTSTSTLRPDAALENRSMPHKSLFSAPTPLQYFASLVAEDSSLALLEAAIAIAQDEYPELDVQAVLSEVDALGAKLKARVPADAAPVQRLRLLNRFFYRELGFAGNVNDYYDRRNSYLNDVLSQRRGIPLTLALLYIELAGHLKLTARGVSFPGHFLVKLRMPQGEVVIDPFNGRSLSREELDERLAPYRRRQGLVGEFEAPLGLFLQAAQPRDVLARMLRNLKEIHRSGRDSLRWLAVQERLVILLPQNWDERRDRALAFSDLGRFDAAIADLEAYLTNRPDADDALAMSERLDQLRRMPRLH
jgi:regulator of sirC expression with transglutaminase-like and TPR domain